MAFGKQKKKDDAFTNSLISNTATFDYYYNRLHALAISCFEWTGLPSTVDTIFLEMLLYENGMAVIFQDEELGYLGLSCATLSNLDVYRIPTKFRAYSATGYSKELDQSNGVIVYNNVIRTNEITAMKMYAYRLANIERTVDVNITAQKTPVLIKCSEAQRMTMENLYMKYNGNQPFIFGDSDLNTDGLQVLNTNAPYVADKLSTMKNQLWNEALTYLGITNVNYEKRERMITDEVMRSQGGTNASRNVRLDARKRACEKMNLLFGWNCDVKFKECIDSSLNTGEESEVE